MWVAKGERMATCEQRRMHGQVLHSMRVGSGSGASVREVCASGMFAVG